MNNRKILGEIVTNQFDDSLEIIEKNNENSSSLNTTFLKDKKSVFYEIPNTPASIRKKRQNSKIRDEIRKSLNSTVTLRKTIEQQQKLREQQVKKNEVKELKEKNLPNTTYIKEDKKVSKHKEKIKICDVIYLKTIDNLLNAIKTELEFGKMNSNFKDDAKYIEIFQENIDKLAAHLHSKIKFNAGLKILKWYRNQLECRKFRKELNDLKVKRNSAIVIQKNWRGYKIKKLFAKLLNENSKKRNQAASIIQRNYRHYMTRKEQKLIKTKAQMLAGQDKQIQSNIIFQKSWSNYWFEKNLNDLDKMRREMINRDNELRDRSARLLQRNWRNYRFKKSLAKLIDHNKELQNRSAIIIQKNWKIYLLKKNLAKLIEQRRIELVSVQNQSVLLIQRNWKNYVFRKNITKLIEKHRLENEASIKIQNAWKKFRFSKQLKEQINLRLKLENRSALIIQSNWRMYQEKKKIKLINQLRNAAFLIQKNWHNYVFRRNLANQIKSNQIKKKNRAALTIQKAWRSYLQFKERVLRQEINRKEMAATLIQKQWRGYITRVKYIRNNKDVSIILERINEVNKNAVTQPSVGEKTKLAIQKLLNYKYHGTALHVLKELEKTTNLSNESCIQLANVMIINVLLKVINECNRSEPCLQTIKLAFSVILNISKNDKAIPIISIIPSLKESIIEILNKHHKRTDIFLKAMTLLYILLKYEDFPDSPAITVKIKRLLNKISKNRQYTSRNSKPVYQFDPRFLSKKQIRTQFYTTKQAIDAFYQIYG